MTIYYVSKEALVSINKELVARSGDPHGILNEANLDFLVDAILYKYEKEAEPVLWKAAFLLDSLQTRATSS